MSKGFVALFGLFTLVAGPILSGFALSVMWGWFVVPVFHLPSLTIPVALGLSIIVGSLTGPHINPKRDEMLKQEKYGTVFLSILLEPLVYLAFGALYHAFM